VVGRSALLPPLLTLSSSTSIVPPKSATFLELEAPVSSESSSFEDEEDGEGAEAEAEADAEAEAEAEEEEDGDVGKNVCFLGAWQKSLNSRNLNTVRRRKDVCVLSVASNGLTFSKVTNTLRKSARNL
tara:strand:+ start:3540 stop:3923 length:384 start_codon:yes stop_codon:yes gene_type:complete